MSLGSTDVPHESMKHQSTQNLVCFGNQREIFLTCNPSSSQVVHTMGKKTPTIYRGCVIKTIKTCNTTSLQKNPTGLGEKNH